jgi:hypothetical protein
MSFQFSPPVDQVLPVTLLTNPIVGFRTDGSSVDVTITVHSESVPQMDRRRLKEAAIWVGLHAVRDGDRLEPVFVFRVGGWYFRAPVDLGDASPKKRKALRRAFAKAMDERTTGSWTFVFRLVDAATMTTAAIRSVSLTKKIRGEAAFLLRKSLNNPRRTRARKEVPLQEAFLTDYELFESLQVSERIA